MKLHRKKLYSLHSFDLVLHSSINCCVVNNRNAMAVHLQVVYLNVVHVYFFLLFCTVPLPIVDVNINPVNPDGLIEGTYIDLVCNASVSEGIDTGDANINITWSKNGNPISNGSDYIISEVIQLSGKYISTVRIVELKKGDDVYKCSVSIVPSVSTYVIGSTGSDEITTMVRGKNE